MTSLSGGQMGPLPLRVFHLRPLSIAIAFAILGFGASWSFAREPLPGSTEYCRGASPPVWSIECDRDTSAPAPTASDLGRPIAIAADDLALEQFLGTAIAAEETAATVEIAPQVDVDPEIIESSPVLRRWLEEVPDVAIDIQHDPAFRTRVRLGYAEFPAADNTGGIYVGVQDLFVGQTPLTISAEYSANGRGDTQIMGADAQYYLLPLGWYGNFGPVLGYRSIQTPDFDSDGINMGFRIVLIPSRTGAADLSLTQSWVAPGTREEVGITTFSAGYAIAEDIRLATDIQTQNSRSDQESRVSLLIEWMP